MYEEDLNYEPKRHIDLTCKYTNYLFFCLQFLISPVCFQTASADGKRIRYGKIYAMAKVGKRRVVVTNTTDCFDGYHANNCLSFQRRLIDVAVKLLLGKHKQTAFYIHWSTTF